jgi:hypothetical protein
MYNIHCNLQIQCSYYALGCSEKQSAVGSRESAVRCKKGYYYASMVCPAQVA